MSAVLPVFTYGLVTALATALGAVPFLFVREMTDRAVSLANAIAAGLMLGASFDLWSKAPIPEPGRPVPGHSSESPSSSLRRGRWQAATSTSETFAGPAPSVSRSSSSS